MGILDPLYWIVSGVMVSIHTALSHIWINKELSYLWSSSRCLESY